MSLIIYIPGGFGIESTVVNFNIGNSIRTGGRTVGDDTLGALFFAGYVLTIAPSQIENIMNGENWSNFLADLGIGYSTPPVGMNLFIASFRFEKPILKLYVATIPFLIILLIALMLITYIPELSLWLVDLLEV